MILVIYTPKSKTGRYTTGDIKSGRPKYSESYILPN